MEHCAHVLGPFPLLFRSSLAHPQVGAVVPSLQQEGIVGVQTGGGDQNLKHRSYVRDLDQAYGDLDRYGGRGSNLSYPGDGAQVPPDLEESGWRRWRVDPQAGRAAPVHDQGFGVEEAQKVGWFFALTHSDLEEETPLSGHL